jgi:UDP-N-acetylglucosamine pyrophosphorylase
MNSAATDAVTVDHLETNNFFGMNRADVFTFKQGAAPRLRPDASLYRDSGGELSLYGPGHGDLLPSLQRSGALTWLKSRGVRYLLAANVDNLAASLSPSLLGLFASSSSQMMAEVCRKETGDVGGCPVAVDGRTQIVEGFAFPVDFDQSSLPAFNTNTLWFRCEALQGELPLHWYLVRKRVDGEDVVQFERLIGQASWFLSSTYALVPRTRFCPIKSLEDLEAAQNTLKALFP